MIARIWHGWTIPENADAYEKLLNEDALMEIESWKIKDDSGVQLVRRNVDQEVEFTTIMRFNSVDNVNVKAFTGKIMNKYTYPIPPTPYWPDSSHGLSIVRWCRR